MKNKPNIQEVIVVEGKTDTIKLQKLFNVQTIETNGSAISKPILNLIDQAYHAHGVILFLDPDGPGEKIRTTIMNNLNINLKHCYISKSDINHHYKKIGIAEANDEAIIKALDSAVTMNPYKSSLSWDEYLTLNLNSKMKRLILTNYLKISPYNHKQLFKRLNMLGYTYKQLKEILDHENENLRK